MNEPNPSPKLSLQQALMWILISTVCMSGSFALGLVYYHYVRDKQKLDPAYRIVAIVQTSPEAEGLRSLYLAELLNLSIDRPVNLYAFDSKKAKDKLLESPVIKEATVRKIKPGTIHVDYVLRKPVAFVGDFDNAAIDADKVIFPFRPFFTPKNLPEILLGNEEDDLNVDWGLPLKGKRVELAFALLHLAKQYGDEFSSLQRIDVTKAFIASYGERQIVMVFEDKIQRVVDGRPVLAVYPRILRLSLNNLPQQLANYQILRKKLLQQTKDLRIPSQATFFKDKATIIDLRLSQLAFITRES